MILIEDLEKKINSELATKIKESKILHDQLYLSINFEDLLDVVLLIKTNKTNKNDIKKILGPIPVIDKKENRWSYFEVRETKTKYGKKDIYVNDYVEVYFDKKGIVKNIEFYTLKEHGNNNYR